MMTDNAFASLIFLLSVRCGDTGKGGAEHRGFLQMMFTHIRCNKQVICSLVGLSFLGHTEFHRELSE